MDSADKRITRQDLVTLIVAYAVALVWLVLQATVGLEAVGCPTKRLLGLPCPGCGLTRAFLLLLHGRVSDAVVMNPNILLAAPLLVLFPLAIVFRRDWLEKGERWVERRWVCIPLLLFELAVWARNVYYSV